MSPHDDAMFETNPRNSTFWLNADSSALRMGPSPYVRQVTSPADRTADSQNKSGPFSWDSRPTNPTVDGNGPAGGSLGVATKLAITF